MPLVGYNVLTAAEKGQYNKFKEDLAALDYKLASQLREINDKLKPPKRMSESGPRKMMNDLFDLMKKYKTAAAVKAALDEMDGPEQEIKSIPEADKNGVDEMMEKLKNGGTLNRSALEKLCASIHEVQLHEASNIKVAGKKLDINFFNRDENIIWTIMQKTDDYSKIVTHMFEKNIIISGAQGQ